ncbi:hypothetical protein MNBD_GAMMA11-1402 [hydrothermal vent metagenome]|uniref:Regulatory protein, RpfE type n=1 Tax=hydrothermal vent metagenome TaxID=652676 RepID=A0A3B0XDM6_9ZZZZ
MRSLDLVIPGLLGPFSTEISANFPPHIHQQLKEVDFHLLKKCLTRARLKTNHCTSYYSTLVDRFSGALAVTENKLAQCELTARHDGIDTSSGFFYRADPVHFKAESDHAILLGSELVLPTDNEKNALISAFNRHFLQEGVCLHASHSLRWYLQVDRPLNLKFYALDYSLGRDIKHFMPEGEDALWWRRILNEAQMLFFQHELNTLREANGQLTINGLWLWDLTAELPSCGQLRAQTEKGRARSENNRKLQKVYADNAVSTALASSLAEWASEQCNHLPVEHYNDQDTFEPDSLIVVEQIYASVCYGDIEAWLNALREYCCEHLPRVVNMLKTGQTDEINVYPCDGRVLSINRGQLIKFWKPLRNIESYFSVSE